jgi:hypothetical protein
VETVSVDASAAVSGGGRPLEVSAAAMEQAAGSTGAFRRAAAELAAGRKVYRKENGDWVFGNAGDAKWEILAPRVGLYEPFTANMDAGWTEWMLDHFAVKHTKLRNANIRSGGLRDRFDVILLAQQALPSMLHGYREGEGGEGRGGLQARQRPEFTGGLGLEGALSLQRFVEDGGTLVTFDTASELPLQMFPIPVRDTLRANAEFYCPGSVLRITVDTSHPLAWGMPENAFAVSTGGMAFDITLLKELNQGERETKAVARYAQEKVLASGWLTGERAVAGRPILVDARMGKGRVVLFGFRPQFRGQSFGTFKLILNAIYRAAAKSNL